MRFLHDIPNGIDSIEGLYQDLDSSQTSNSTVVFETAKGPQMGITVLVDEQAATEGFSGTIKALLIATKSNGVICHVPVGLPTLDANRSPGHWNWTVACHLKPGVINRYILGETTCNDDDFKTRIVQELDDDFLPILPKVFQGLSDFLGVSDKNEVMHARRFLEETRPDWEWQWSQYDQ